MYVDNPGITHTAGCDDAANRHHQPAAAFKRQCRPCFTGNRRLVAPGAREKRLVLGFDRWFNGQLHISNTIFCAFGRLFIGGHVYKIAAKPHLADSDPGDVNSHGRGHILDALYGDRCAFYQRPGVTLSRQSKLCDHAKCIVEPDISVTGLRIND